MARVSSPSRVVDRTSPSLVTEKITSPSRSSPNRLERNMPVAKIAERVRLKKVDNHVTGSDIATFGVSCKIQNKVLIYDFVRLTAEILLNICRCATRK